MPSTKRETRSGNIGERIDELRRKIQLLEGDRKAYYEGAEYKMDENRKTIAKRRQENKELRKVMADKLAADEYVVSKGLEDNPAERNALRSKPGNVAIVVMDEKVRDRVNVLNTMRYRSKQKQARIRELELQSKQMGGGGGGGGGLDREEDGASEETKPSPPPSAGSSNETEEAQKLRNLENRLDKASLKCKEAEHIQKTYLQIKSKLEDEHKTFENTLDDMEHDIKRLKQQLKDLKVMRNDAQIARDNAKAELERQEKELMADRRRRELEMQRVKKEADEKRSLHENMQRRIDARGSMMQEDLTAEQKQSLGVGEEDQERIRTYEDAFRRIKEATGVSDTQEVVLRFENQGETGRHLEELKVHNQQEIERLVEERNALQLEFSQMKYSGEAKLSSGQTLLEEYETRVAEEERRKDESQQRLEKSSRVLTDAKSGVEHLNEKLKILKAAPSDVQKTKVAPGSDEYVLDQLCVCEEKLMRLLEELDGSGKDVNEISRQMEEAEFHNTLEIKLPTYNTRVKLPVAAKDTMYDDEDASGEDEDVMTRQGLKKQSQQMIDAKNRRRPGKRKKKVTK